MAVFAFVILGLIICFFKDCTATPSIMVATGILIPLIVLLIVWWSPKQSPSTVLNTNPTDPFRIRTGIFSTLIIVVCILVTLLMCIGKMTTLTGIRVDSEQTEANNAKRLKNIQQQVKNEMLRSEQGDLENQNEKSYGFGEEESPLKEAHDEDLHRVD